MLTHSIHQKEVLTTGDVARACHVAPRTVSKWFDTGRLRGYRIPGSRDRRIPTEHLLAFMRANGIPLDDMDGGTCRVLLVGSHPQELDQVLAGLNRYDIRRAANGFEAGLVAHQHHPHVIVLQVGDSQAEAMQFARCIRGSNELIGVKLLAAVDTDFAGELPQGLFDGLVPKLYSPSQLVSAIEQVTNIL
jgi:excisionase family DNA binding protein